MQRVILHGLIAATAAVAVVLAAIAFGKVLNDRGVFLEYNPPGHAEPTPSVRNGDQVGLLIEHNRTAVAINAAADAGEDMMDLAARVRAGDPAAVRQALDASEREAAAEALELDDIRGK